MSKFVIYIPLEKYLQEWLTHRLGSPVVFPYGSNENAVIRTFIQKTPPDAKPVLPDEALTPIAIPDSAAKPPEHYNHIGPRGMKALRECIKDLFIRALWADLSPLVNTAVGFNKLVSAWCESNGIGLDRVETVRQCFYRIRKSYADQGVNLRINSRKRLP